jgi:transposase
MIHLPASVRVYLCLSPCDMRRSFDGLHTLVRDHLHWDAFAGHLYLFANKRKDRVKILYWNHDGFAICGETFGGRPLRDPLWRSGIGSL